MLRKRQISKHHISTHTLHAEGDFSDYVDGLLQVAFQPTPSMRRVTERMIEDIIDCDISIHTLHAEGDG